jgi:alkanesulfonate monooxygenase SsuD/methylene tetrahydromethanopterin reductase-like flavin-dependent oxidoreductase (luciferase family)
MSDYGHDLLFGVFITPVAKPEQQAVDLAVLADRSGIDLITFQDHPYQSNFHDTWTLMSYVAARTQNAHISANVLNLPLRGPAMVARGAATLDRLSGGRFELGIGSGAFWDAIVAMGGERRTPGESIQALEEGIQIIKQIWDTDTPGGVKVDGDFYKVKGAKRGPKPAHKINIWVGAYKPRILRMVGRIADGSLPSLGYLQGGMAQLDEIHQHIDEGAAKVGRDPREIRRMLNINGQLSQQRGGLLIGPPEQWVEELADLTINHGVSAFIMTADDPYMIELFAKQIAPATRELVARERRR